jgi:hypothetical protein
MTTVALVLSAVLAVAAVLFVARPFLRAPSRQEPATAREGTEDGRLELLEARDRALAALKELEFDHRTGKVSDADYATAVVALRREAARALVALEPPAVSKDEAVEQPQGRA